MQRKWYAPPEALRNALAPIHVGRFLIRRRTRAVLAWTAVLIAAAAASYLAWTGYDEEGRPERTVGYIYIDFSGQWLMGRMLARGEGPYLYNREHLHRALLDAYPLNPRRTEAGDRQDANNVFSWLVTSPEHPNVGGALYPPIHALYFYPLGLLPPLPAYRVAQALNLLLTFASGFLAWMLTRGRIWAAVGAAAVLALPGYNGALGLAQNSPLSLALAMLGWLLVARDRPWLGGVAWGFLAFKPVWAAALFLAPLLSGRWRVCVAMLLTGAALALLTLPFVGVHAWFDWLEVGRTASGEYRSSENWIFLSRDLQGLPRRWLHFVQGNPTNGEDPFTNILGVGLWLAVPLLTTAVAVWRWRRPAGDDRDGRRVPPAGRVPELLPLHVLRRAAGGVAVVRAVRRAGPLPAAGVRPPARPARRLALELRSRDPDDAVLRSAAHQRRRRFHDEQGTPQHALLAVGHLLPAGPVGVVRLAVAHSEG